MCPSHTLRIANAFLRFYTRVLFKINIQFEEEYCHSQKIQGWGPEIEMYVCQMDHGAGAEPGAPNAQGKKNHMDKSLLSRRALVNLTLSGTFLFPMETPLSVKLCTEHGAPKNKVSHCFPTYLP